jgi:hypothetical protein
MTRTVHLKVPSDGCRRQLALRHLLGWFIGIGSVVVCFWLAVSAHERSVVQTVGCSAVLWMIALNAISSRNAATPILLLAVMIGAITGQWDSWPLTCAIGIAVIAWLSFHKIGVRFNCWNIIDTDSLTIASGMVVTAMSARGVALGKSARRLDIGSDFGEALIGIGIVALLCHVIRAYLKTMQSKRKSKMSNDGELTRKKGSTGPAAEQCFKAIAI